MPRIGSWSCSVSAKLLYSETIIHHDLDGTIAAVAIAPLVWHHPLLNEHVARKNVEMGMLELVCY